VRRRSGRRRLKATRGLVPRTGVAPLSWTLDHVGPTARSAADLGQHRVVLHRREPAVRHADAQAREVPGA
jgi:Asp-tRNA(Asn)/Glu-tRNA(Gln) amidotransferase A subunit family amidase